MKIVIIKYDAGNISSVLNAANRAGATAIVSDDEKVIKSADKVILPGVGAAGKAMQSLKEKKLDVIIKNLQLPVLGICLGMQLMCTYSEENDTTCMGIFDQKVQRFTGSEKIPHVGWNTLEDLKSPLFKGVSENAYMYFVHSFYVPLSQHTISVTQYIHSYSSALQLNNFYGVQFHPEKSGKTGQQIISNFISL